MNKCKLREHLRVAIGGLSAKSKNEQSYLLFRKLIEHERYLEANKLSIYLSTDKEVDTKLILRHSLEVANKQCYIPFVRKSKSQLGSTDTRMIMVRIHSMREYEELPLNHYGIKEPTSPGRATEVADPLTGDLDLILVPGLAFSLDGKRLGHGKGYYDEFLTNWRDKAEKSIYSIGLALREQIRDDIPIVSGSDFILDEVLTAL